MGFLKKITKFLILFYLSSVVVSWVEAEGVVKRDYYQILGVQRSATDRQIKKAFRKLALKFHPDKNESEDAAEKFSEISEAYQVLKDKDKRLDYDTAGHDAFKNGWTNKDRNPDVKKTFKNFNFNPEGIKVTPGTRYRYHRNEASRRPAENFRNGGRWASKM